MTDSTPAPTSAAPEPTELEKAAESILSRKSLVPIIKERILNAENAAHTANELAEWTGLPAKPVALALKYAIFPMLAKGLGKAEGIAKSAFAKRISRLPYVKDILSKLEEWMETLDPKKKSEPPQKPALSVEEYVSLSAESVLQELSHLSDDMQEQFSDLKKELCAILEMQNETLEAILGKLTPEPPLALPLSTDKTGINRFVYNTRHIPYQTQGIQPALKEVHTFLTKDEPFSWHIVYGPAGTGKSRFALELCLDIGATDWQCGFIDLPDNSSGVFHYNWKEWEPTLPTLIVVDYVVQRTQSIHTMLKAMAGYSGNEPVRVLLLEREAKGIKPKNEGDLFDLDAFKDAVPWYEEIIGTQWRDNTIVTKNHGTPTELGKPTKQDLRNIIQVFVEGEDKQRTILEKLQELAPDRRPLFAAILADDFANASKETGSDKTIEEIVGRFIKREETNYWLPVYNGDKNLCERDKRLFCMASMCGGLKLDNPINCLPDSATSCAEFRDCQERLTVFGGNAKELPAWQPDVLAECLVKDTLARPTHLLRGSAEIVTCAWRTAPINVAKFFFRLWQDFPGEAFRKLFDPSLLPDGISFEVLWASVASSVVGESSVEIVEDYYAHLCDSFNKHKSSNIFSQMFATVTNNLLRRFLKENNQKQLRGIIAALPSVNISDRRGMTPLHIAASFPAPMVLNEILRAGADPNLSSANGMAPLHYAAGNGFVKSAQLLIDAGANVNAMTSDQITPLLGAVLRDKPTMIPLLAKAGADVNILLQEGSATPLTYAIRLNYIESINALIQAGANLNQQDVQFPPLAAAVRVGSPEIARILIEHGANPDLACSDRTPLILAVHNNDIKMVRTLIEAGADVNRIEKGVSPLDVAAYEGFNEITQALIQANVDLNARTNSGAHPLYLATLQCHPKTVKTLLGARTNERIKPRFVATALELALAHGFPEIANILSDSTDTTKT